MRRPDARREKPACSAHPSLRSSLSVGGFGSRATLSHRDSSACEGTANCTGAYAVALLPNEASLLRLVSTMPAEIRRVASSLAGEVLQQRRGHPIGGGGVF
ncbi:MAG TPA: hypothetical protein DEP35_08730, partial [Deltaproteobacteria bacterium]|nr:hypothetical protein [Deltaproteobacteria bacterium]